MKKELAGLQSVNYSYGKHIPIKVSSDSYWNFPEIPNNICIPCGNAGNGNIDECNCTIVDDVVDNTVNISMDESLDIASVTDHRETASFNILPLDDSSVEDLLSMDNNSVVETQQNLNDDKEQNESKNYIENPDQEYTYSALNELGNKIISFPELKSQVEENFVCKKCLFHMGPSAIHTSKYIVGSTTKVGNYNCHKNYMWQCTLC